LHGAEELGRFEDVLDDAVESGGEGFWVDEAVLLGELGLRDEVLLGLGEDLLA
jgi:hypothetical protein